MVCFSSKVWSSVGEEGEGLLCGDAGCLISEEEGEGPVAVVRGELSGWMDGFWEDSLPARMRSTIAARVSRSCSAVSARHL